MSKKLLPEAEDGEGEITVSVEGYGETVPLGAAAAADFPPEDFDDKFLTCDICQNIFDDPRILPCHHTFCARCLKRWCKGKSQFTCPTCRYQVTLQETGVSSLPLDFYKKNLLDFRASKSKEIKEAHSQCQMCESEARIAGLCRNCNYFLCKNCLTAHSKAPALKNHNITLLNAPTEYCSQHTDQRLTFYCRPCEKLVCHNCIKTEHQPGPEHDPQEVSKVAQACRDELQTLVGKTQNKLKATDYLLRIEATSIRTNSELQKKKIQEHFAQLRAQLDREEKDLTSRLKEMEEEQQTSLSEKRKDFEETSKPTEERLKFCREMLAGSSDVEVLTLREQLEYNLNHLKTQEISLTDLPVNQEITFTTPQAMNTLPGNMYSPGIVEQEPLRLSPGILESRNTSIKVTELPVECLPTNFIVNMADSFPSVFHNEETVMQLTVIQGEPDTKMMLTVSQLEEKRRIILDTTRISEGVFEAVWRPQTSGKHQVGIGIGSRNTTQWPRIVESSITFDVFSNNPVLKFGQKGSQQGQFDTPIGVAVSGDRLYVADYENNRVQVFDLVGNFCFLLPTSTKPGSVAVQSDGTIVVRCGTESVMRFSPSGELKNEFPLREHCTKPYGLAVQRNGRVVVADNVKHCVFLFEANGTMVKQVGGQGKRRKFDTPGFVCVDKEDNIIVSDKLNHRVQVFDRNLDFRHKFGQKGRQPHDMFGPMGVTADSRGNIVLANIGEKSDVGGVEHGKKLQVFRPDGTWVSTISSDGDKLKVPCGVAVTEDGHVFVADAKDHCIRKYRYM
ncbi:PREDICTED: tripartite motif-containing protein 2-like [Branchiostoma belcheri]|uniref:RING-type E3 ubiquitin transferase n=1 Tax=Branchiostoma belcheri TaxID=7741 RepID=A0A6P4ZVQ9_BRABE|nr:PREDICTED: tripartite motif-containing protein 2-like [Branchiostoma belcheri]